jgi:methylsterol monooxygenase
MNSTLTYDPSQLNWLETRWEQMYEGRNPLVVTGIFAFLMHEFVYFGRFIPFLICDFIPYFKQYKLQEVTTIHRRRTFDFILIASIFLSGKRKLL